MRTKGNRRIVYTGSGVLVEYRRDVWNRGEAWMHLWKYPPAGALVQGPAGRNLWMSRHEKDSWAWWAPRNIEGAQQ